MSYTQFALAIVPPFLFGMLYPVAAGRYPRVFRRRSVVVALLILSAIYGWTLT